jgi:hypothetical protein
MQKHPRNFRSEYFSFETETILNQHFSFHFGYNNRNDSNFLDLKRLLEYELARDHKLYDPSFKGGVELDLLDLRAQAKLSNGAILTLLHNKEKLYKEELCGISAEYDEPFSDLLNVKTMRLFEAGIIQHWMDESKKFLDFNYYQRPLMLTKEYLHQIYPQTHPEGPQKLNLYGLEADLYSIWLLLDCRFWCSVLNGFVDSKTTW